jgi:UDP-N-acetylglucosamine diphosphorylase/glucosamine-1-phosphate N-acetyltransferase
MKPLAAIILAAGKGTRMKSSRAKVTFPILDKPMVQKVVDTALSLECSKVCVVVGYQKESVIACLENDARLEFVEQVEQLGTGHAVMTTESIYSGFEGDLFILCGDVPLTRKSTLQAMYDIHVRENAACTVLTACLDDPGKYGRIVRDQSGNVSGIVEFKDATVTQRAIKEWNTGIYCFRASELFGALKGISNHNMQTEYYLTDVISILHSQGKNVASVVLDDLTEVAGVNSLKQLADLENAYAGSIRDSWMDQGVMLHNPATVMIGEDVVLEKDVEIGPNCIIKGKTYIESGCMIGPNCYIDSCRVCNDSILEGYNILVHAHIPEQHILEFGEKVVEEASYE